MPYAELPLFPLGSVLFPGGSLPLRIFDMAQPGVLLRILRGEQIGTLVHGRNGTAA